MKGLILLTALTLLVLMAAILPLPRASHGETVSDLLEEAYLTPLDKPRKLDDLTLPDIHGSQFRLADVRGKIVLLNFWAIWCGPCRHEMPSIERLHQHFKGQDLHVVAVSVDLADIEYVKTFVEEQKYTFTVLHDPRGSVMAALGARLIPVSYVIDKSGRVVGMALGYRDWSRPAVIRLFEELLK